VAGSAQMFSSARDMAAFVAANLGELENERPLQDAMQFAQQALIPAGPHRSQALAWDILGFGEQTIVEKNGGLNNSSIYIGMVKRAKLGIVILCNRGNQETVETGRRILLRLARQERLG
jgi:beta-lactamase class C